MAKRGCGALEAIWFSEAQYEIAKHSGEEVISLLLDMEKFDDNIGWRTGSHR